MLNTTIHQNALRRQARGGLPLSSPAAMQNGGSDSAAPGAPAPPCSEQRAPAFRFHEPHHQAGFSRHLQQHSKRTCPKCLWARCRQRWMRTTPLHPTHYMRTSWLEVRPSTSRSWALGCWVCRQAIGNNDGHAGGPFVTCSVRRPNKARIKKHHRSSYHQRSVLALLHHRGLANVEDDGVPAPPVA